MSEDAEGKELIRGMKHLLIHKLLQIKFRVLENLGAQRGVDLAVCEIVDGELKCVTVQVRASSLHSPKEGSKRWYYEFSVAGKSEFNKSSKFFHVLCLEEKDELRPTFLIIPNPKLKELLKENMESLSSWRDKAPYTRALTRNQLLEEKWIKYKDKFELIDEALGSRQHKQPIRESLKYWNSKDAQ